MNTKWSSRISSEEECEQEHLCPRHQSKVRVVMSSDFQLCSEHSDEHQHQVTLIHVNSEQFGWDHGYTECVSQRGCGEVGSLSQGRGTLMKFAFR